MDNIEIPVSNPNLKQSVWAGRGVIIFIVGALLFMAAVVYFVFIGPKLEEDKLLD